MSLKSLQSPPPPFPPETMLKVFRLVNHCLRHLSNIAMLKVFRLVNHCLRHLSNIAMLKVFRLVNHCLRHLSNIVMLKVFRLVNHCLRHLSNIAMLKVFRLVNHCLRHLSNIERRGRGGKYSERYTNFENLQSVADVLSGIVVTKYVDIKLTVALQA